MDITIRPLQENELVTADQIFRVAFGTFIGLPDPTQFGGDASYIQHRWQTEPRGAFAAEIDGQFVGSNLATCWGRFGFFGPLSVHPDFWGRGVGKYLVEAIADYFVQQQITLAGLFTFPNSPKHHALYQKFGFYPRFLTAVMAKSVQIKERSLLRARYSQMSENERTQCLNACRELTNALYEGLDLSLEIQAVQALELGDTVFLWDDGLAGFAVCHYGAGTEAGSNNCYVKFGAVQPGTKAGQQFEQLLDLCEALSGDRGMSRLVMGVNTSHQEAYQRAIARGFRTEITGVAMHQSNQPGYSRPDLFTLNDWR